MSQDRFLLATAVVALMALGFLLAPCDLGATDVDESGRSRNHAADAAASRHAVSGSVMPDGAGHRLPSASSAVSATAVDAPSDAGYGLSDANGALPEAVRGRAQLSSPRAGGLWQRLVALSDRDRGDTLIEIEPLTRRRPELEGEIASIESSWRRGACDDAIARLRRMESLFPGDDFALGMSFRSPRPLEPWGTDVVVADRFGDQVVLDFHAATGHLFTVVQFEGDDDYNWSVYLSTDDGSTWVETYHWVMLRVLSDVSAVVVNDYLYVTYATVQHTTPFVRLRRCHTASGVSDASYGYHTLIEGTALDLALASSADYGAGVLYHLALTEDGSILYHWSNWQGESWTPVATGISGAVRGLDAATNESFAEHFLFVSWIDTSYRFHVARRSAGGWDDHDLDFAATVTSIAAYDDRILAAIEHRYPDSARGIKYWVSYDGGGAWFYGDVEVDPDRVFVQPDVTGRRGGGFTVVYEEEAGEPDGCWTRHRDYGTGGGTAPWDAPVQINELDVATGTPLKVEWVPPVDGALHAYGAVWVSSGAYGPVCFDRAEGTTTGIAAQPVVSVRGGGMIAWPMPYRGGALNIALSPPWSDVGAPLEIGLYDATGRLVVGIVPGRRAGGVGSTWDGRDGAGRSVPSGVYFLQARSGSARSTLKLLVAR